MHIELARCWPLSFHLPNLTETLQGHGVTAYIVMKIQVAFYKATPNVLVATFHNQAGKETKHVHLKPRKQDHEGTVSFYN